MPKMITTPVSIESLLYGEDQDLDSLRTINGGFQYEFVNVSATNQVMGATGASGDYLDKLICVVTNVTTSQVQIKDGSGTAITVLPNNVAAIGTYVIPIGLKSTVGSWQVSTAATVTVLATGLFS